jgi:two-component system NtrC family response regulator
MKPTLLIVDDDEEIRTQMKWALAGDYEILVAGDRAAALQAFAAGRPTVTLLDLGLPPHPNSPDEGLATLAALLAADRTAKVLIISGQGEKENAIQAVGAGAWDFLCKPVDTDELKLLLSRCCYISGLEREYQDTQKGLQAEVFEGMLGSSAVMRDVFASIRKVAVSSAPVLILGKSGTGKEMAARALHRRSACKDGPFVAINCNAIPESLMESELFGHEKGAFTGANSQRKGLIESASGGTLFLDEIGELPAPIQVKLLRFLQEKTFQRVGGRQEIESDVRIVAATNADLKEMVTAGTFREDLYFRLAVVTISLPELGNRGDDIVLVAREFLERFAKQNGKKGLTFTPEAVRAILKHSWPGNIRELQNRVQRAVIMADGKRITPKDMELESLDEDGIMSLREARENVEREVVVNALKRSRGKISAAATELGISRPTLYELMDKLGIARE